MLQFRDKRYKHRSRSVVVRSDMGEGQVKERIGQGQQQIGFGVKVRDSGSQKGKTSYFIPHEHASCNPNTTYVYSTNDIA